MNAECKMMNDELRRFLSLIHHSSFSSSSPQAAFLLDFSHIKPFSSSNRYSQNVSRKVCKYK